MVKDGSVEAENGPGQALGWEDTARGVSTEVNCYLMFSQVGTPFS